MRAAARISSFGVREDHQRFYVAVRRPSLLLAALILLVVLETPPGAGQGQRSPIQLPLANATEYVGSASCSGCHAREAEAWRTSHHFRAMAVADETSVVGDFNGASAPDQRMMARFFRRDARYMIEAEGRDGRTQEFSVTHTFGTEPLQQYLISFPDGRRQAFWMAWDTRPADHGGQRWFHLYPDQAIPPDDSLHWTGRDQTWNHMCADCHSTNVRRNFDLAANRYDTSFSEINVSCESCHGPGGRHLRWASGDESARAADPDLGLAMSPRRESGAWRIADAARGIARWTGPARTSARREVEMCAQCHALRRPIVRDPGVGRPLLDTHVPSLLAAGAYHADGQILGEVFEYGSFVQSRMHRAGVTCSDCHEPHSGRLRAEGNAVCAQCHAPERFDHAEHHRHAAGSAGSQCVDCHMPSRTYMMVDPRRDHSFRVPRPDLSVALGVPNACTGCHADRTAEWALQTVIAWHGPGRRREPHFAAALDAGRREAVDAERRLAALIGDDAQPAIARATALTLLPRELGPGTLPAIGRALVDADPLVRGTAVRAVAGMPPAARVRAVAPLLVDPIRYVRIETARALADAPSGLLAPPQAEAYGRAFAELVESEMIAADRPESHLNLAVLHLRSDWPREAEASLQTALRLDPAFVPALVNLADLYRTTNREGDEDSSLRRALEIAPDNAEAMHALGLLRVRQRRHPEALDLLRRSAQARPDSAQFAYVYGVALNSTGFAAVAIDTLRRANERHPNNRDILAALVAFQRDRGDLAGAERDAERLLELAPYDRRFRVLLDQIRLQRQRR